MSESRLQRSEIPLEHELVVVLPVHPGRERIRLLQPGYTLEVTPEEAYAIGSSLVDQAKECGYDEDTGETNRVESSEEGSASGAKP